jgi:hypothetical protein
MSSSPPFQTCTAGMVAGSGTPLSLCQASQPAGVCETLQAEGATDQNLIDVAAGCLDPTLLLSYLTGGGIPPLEPSYNVPGIVANAVLPSFGPTTSIPTALTSAGSAISTAASNASAAIQNALPGILSGLGTAGLWIIGIVVVAIVLFLIFEFNR